MTQPQLIQCDEHGMSPFYVICPHVHLLKAPPVYAERATEKRPGQGVCQTCYDQPGDLSIDDAFVICAGHFAEDAKVFGWDLETAYAKGDSRVQR